MVCDSPLRQRRRPPQPKQDALTHNSDACTPPKPARTRTTRFFLVWAARILLPIVYILSTAKPVVINAPPPSTHSHSSQASIPQTTAVLLITHSRPAYLSRALNSLLTHHPESHHWPIIVSQDMQDQEYSNVTQVVSLFADKATSRNMTFLHWTHAKSYQEDVDKETFIDTLAYRRISRHYYDALSRIFETTINGQALARVIVLEDDMEISSDFFSYFHALTPLLESDDTLFCISAWNDNGIASLAHDKEQLHRTDFFPGLGWMLTRELWEELSPKWPKLFWDDWLRHPDQTLGRQCIRPEMSRTANFGEKGVSQSFHYTKHVSQVALGTEEVDFGSLDLSYLNAEAYEDMMFSRMSNAVALRFSNYLSSRPQATDVIAFYPEGGLEAIGKRTGIMIDHRNGVRRTSYKGVVVIPWNGHWAFIVQRGWMPPEGYQLGASECC